MVTAKQATEILADAERSMRELVGIAASAGDYELVIRLTEWARQLSAIARSAEHKPTGATIVLDSGNARVPEARSQRKVRPGKRIRRRSARGQKKGNFPRFVRRNDSLVKIGWSKTDRSEYEHRAPREVAMLLASAVRKRAENGNLVRAEDVMPVLDPRDGAEIPSYQAYLCLAWLKHEGLVVPQGRKGYTVPNTGALESTVEKKWATLPVD